MAKHRKLRNNVAAIYQQDALPHRIARRLDYDTGFALGIAGGIGGHRALAELLRNARDLMQEHVFYCDVAEMMGIAPNGLCGLLDGSGYRQPIPEEGVDLALLIAEERRCEMNSRPTLELVAG